MRKRAHTLARAAGLLAMLALCISCATSPVATKPKPVTAASAGAVTAQANCGYLAGPVQKFTLGLYRAYTMMEASGTSAAPAKLPAGTYSVEAWMLEQPDASGATWRISGMYAQPCSIEVRANETTTMTFGLPLRATLQWSRAGDVVVFGIVLAGQGGERYSPSSIARGGQRVDAPGVKIVDSGGRVISEGRFRYG